MKEISHDTRLKALYEARSLLDQGNITIDYFFALTFAYPEASDRILAKWYADEGQVNFNSAKDMLIYVSGIVLTKGYENPPVFPGNQRFTEDDWKWLETVMDAGIEFTEGIDLKSTIKKMFE